MPTVSFHTACVKWKADKKNYVKDSTLAAYSLTITKHLEPRFRTLDEVTPAAAQELADSKIRSGMSVPSVRGMLIVLKMVARFCERQGWMEPKPLEVRWPPMWRKPRIDVMTVPEERLLLGYLASHRGLYDLGLLVCVYTGVRIGEVCGLKWEDVDLGAGVIRIRRTAHRVYRPGRGTRLTVGNPKTAGSYREIPVIKPLAAALYEYSRTASVRGGCYVLTGNARPAEPQTLRNHFKKVTADLGISMRRFHGLRHTFATRCVESRCDYKILSSILGHASVSTTLNLYVHPGLEQKRLLVERMDSTLAETT